MTINDRVRHVLSVMLKIEIAKNVDLIRENSENWDSLKHMEIIFALEDEFNIQFEEETISKINSISTITEAIEAKNAS